MKILKWRGWVQRSKAELYKLHEDRSLHFWRYRRNWSGRFHSCKRSVGMWVYPVWDSLCFLDLGDYLLSHVRFQTKIEKMVELTQLMDNEVFMAFASYTTIVLSKMMFMSTATAFYRLTRKVFANPEDCAGFGKGENAKKYLRTDDRVERVRR
ncbi:microsomal glutathione S-transferase 1 isoform X2 [Balaenoptera ricei]|uniref:microsomal glutathione S-transferase 1 isoform X2 n=1 Tax=Balaenoptera ricei TaxID=2746895 RepID=UPI0028BE71A9|nr:microsomal glutathione S-transferase 1 isoform X2 [Balaenoptera ricei]